MILPKLALLGRVTNVYFEHPIHRGIQTKQTTNISAAHFRHLFARLVLLTVLC